MDKVPKVMYKYVQHKKCVYFKYNGGFNGWTMIRKTTIVF
jgi:hypothetical protein